MNIEFARVKDSAILFVIALFIGTGGYSLIDRTEQRVNTTRLDQESTLAQLENELQTRKQNRQIVAKHRSGFLDLLASGRFAEENRMNWVVSVKQQANNMKLPSIKYSLGSRHPVTDPVLSSLPGISIYETPIELEMELVHEADLINMIEYLSLSGLGRFNTKQCELTRTTASNEFLPDQANISATCSLKWISFGNNPAVQSTATGLL